MFYWQSLSRIPSFVRPSNNAGKRRCDKWTGGSILLCGPLGFKSSASWMPGHVEVDAEWFVGPKDKKIGIVIMQILIDHRSSVDR